jgi:(S)-ureidoglycine aminohydrolase
MRAPHELVSSRARVRPRYALVPLEGYPLSRLPAWPDAAARVLASPALGAAFVEILLDLAAGQAGGYPADGRTETFLFVVAGAADLVIDGGRRQPLAAGGFALVPAASGFTLTATAVSPAAAVRVLLLRKTFEPLAGVAAPPPLVGRESDVADTVYLGDEGALLKTLVPDEPGYDLAMNIFTFAPGHGLPVVETHVMEHGLFVLQGRGLYYLDDTWMEVDRDDFIWMGPYVPQSFVAAGPTPTRYIYYKNVNRDVPPT